MTRSFPFAIQAQKNEAFFLLNALNVCINNRRIFAVNDSYIYRKKFENGKIYLRVW